MQYDKVYFQKEGEDKDLVETVSAFDIYCSDMPFIVAGKAKELTTRDWYDEDGTDAYVPSELKMESYSMEVSFCCKGNRDSSNAKIYAFVDYLAGHRGDGVYMKMFDTYTEIGRQHVRFSELKDDAELVRDVNGDILTFTVEFIVDDPVTVVTPTYDTSNNVTSLD